MVRRSGFLLLLLLVGAAVTPAAAPVVAAPVASLSPAAPVESDYYRLVDITLARAGTDSRSSTWKPGAALSKQPVMEVSGLAVLKDRKLMVTTRMGDVWLVDGAYREPPAPRFKRFAAALHEPLGILQDGDGFLVIQRTELTRLRDTDGDGAADEYLTASNGWNVSGNYHEYAFGPKRDGDGKLWLTLNLGLGGGADNSKPWRGWAVTVGPDGAVKPMCAGLRSPCALGANLEGDMFMGDQQGNWVPANSIHHLREGVFLGNAESVKSFSHPQSPLRLSMPLPNNVPYPEALAAVPELKPPAVWIPYPNPGQSSTDIVADSTGGKFGPFAGQLFVGDFTNACVNRVFLEKVNGEYQGACFPFRRDFASAVVRIAFGEDGSLFAGLTNRGWSSLGNASHGLQRLVWTGKTPFEIKEMRATRDGFELVFTAAADPATAGDPANYRGRSHTYVYSDKYGSPDVDAKPLKITAAKVAKDNLSVRLTVEPLRRFYVHELTAKGVRSADGLPLLHPIGWYTLNEIPN
jgi:hypothetical protein